MALEVNQEDSSTHPPHPLIMIIQYTIIILNGIEINITPYNYLCRTADLSSSSPVLPEGAYSLEDNTALSCLKTQRI